MKFLQSNFLGYIANAAIWSLYSMYFIECFELESLYFSNKIWNWNEHLTMKSHHLRVILKRKCCCYRLTMTLEMFGYGTKWTNEVHVMEMWNIWGIFCLDVFGRKLDFGMIGVGWNEKCLLLIWVNGNGMIMSSMVEFMLYVIECRSVCLQYGYYQMFIPCVNGSAVDLLLILRECIHTCHMVHITASCAGRNAEMIEIRAHLARSFTLWSMLSNCSGHVCHIAWFVDKVIICDHNHLWTMYDKPSVVMILVWWTACASYQVIGAA